MLITIIVLSVTVLLLILLLSFCTYMLIDVRARYEFAIDTLRDTERTINRVQNLVHGKFDYYVPLSDVYLIIEEEKLRQAKGGEE